MDKGVELQMQRSLIQEEANKAICFACGILDTLLKSADEGDSATQ